MPEGVGVSEEEKGAGGREDRGERGGGKQGKQERLGEKEEAKTEEEIPIVGDEG